MAERPPLRRVLIVEDEAALRRAYERHFAGRYALAFAPTGAVARAELAREAPDVIVLDLHLPDADGVELLDEIRRVAGDVPVIITTSYVSMQPVVEVMGVAHSGYLVKPFDLDDLAARIDAIP